MATRASGTREYDHGAQYFTVRDPRFDLRVASWVDDGIVAEWKGRFVALEGETRRPTSGSTRRYVGVPRMSAVAEHLAADLDVRRGARVTALARRGREWIVSRDGGEADSCDGVVVAVPAPLAVPLLAAAPALRERVAGVRMDGCWSVLVGFDSPRETGFDGAFVNGGPLSWIARNHSKPGRGAEAWVLHASPAWTARHADSRPPEVAAALLDAFAAAAGVEPGPPAEVEAHRWSHAIPVEPLPEPCLFDGSLAVAVCGDYCGGPRVEGAFLSGAAAAGRMLSHAAGIRAPEQPSLF